MALKFTVLSFLFISLFSCSQEKVNYHSVNQPKYQTDNFLDKENLHSGKVYNNVKFIDNKRQSYTEINFFEQLFRSLKGNIKSVKIKEYNSESVLWMTQIFEFNKKGEIMKKSWAYQDSNLMDEPILKDTLFADLDVNAKDSISIKNNLVEFVIHKGKLFAENSNLYNNFPHMKYTYHENGKKAISRSLTNWATSYYNKQGILDSIVDQNSKKDPTENLVERFVYKNGLIEKFVSEQNKIEDQKPITTYARVVKATYFKDTDLPLHVEEMSYDDNYQINGSKEIRTYQYNEKNELISSLLTFEGKDPTYMKFQTDYQYKYDKQGNWTTVLRTSFHHDKPTEKSTIKYVIEYEYF